ncbi:hypothetical protein Mp_2g13900 [Marchantia polymorpha subsp. ruderalis]|uniref:Magnesium-dependent phosphatase-1 n=1 Tax=Marchantia polymorpha TaxID=3197 RepID=A0A2R6X1K6_MARPO|nr:hypothetical protein MARPO_0042s0019 [Marchantia polymorpha]PTQ39961.1 hypothetical protein MARPO_0042s0019 [Marchantia polymorpha]BBN02262.1 hypothetical protein Mp_2g13900 [Marchantia polymorpha subsp. ruderalis]BBN02263.1 hypothetical protein Mp_2g13900 [Marchantia polymorpha subsp. ruderalis]|eukprot:PTQ39960.1 hypothetical protein MARPO_0042s0019 [Marchantia polymorpha]
MLGSYSYMNELSLDGLARPVASSECLSKNDNPVLYPQAKGIIQALKSKGISMAIASRSPTADIARTFLSKQDILSNFPVMEIYSSWTHKTDHFRKIHQKTGVPYNSILFFDDEHRNIQAVRNMGVTCVHVSSGVNLDALKTGLQGFAGTNSDPQYRTLGA